VARRDGGRGERERERERERDRLEARRMTRGFTIARENATRCYFPAGRLVARA